MAKKPSVELCDHRDVSGPLFPGHRLGGMTIGRCRNPVLPGFVVCREHVSKDALLLRIQYLEKHHHAKV